MSHEEDDEANREKQAKELIKDRHRERDAQVLSPSQLKDLEFFVPKAFPAGYLQMINWLATQVSKMFEGEKFYGRTGARKVHLTSASINLRKALRAIRQLDDRTVSGWVETLADKPSDIVSTLYGESPVERLLSIQLMLMCVEALAEHFERLASAAPRAREGRPARSDALSFGVEALAALYAKHRGEKPTSSIKENGFGDVCRRFFAIIRPDLSSGVDQAVLAEVARRAANKR